MVYMRRNLKSKKINDLLSDFIDFSKNKKPTNFFSLWKRVSGEKIALETDSVYYNNNTLFVKLKNPDFKSVLSNQEKEIMKRIRLLNSNVKKIVFD